MRIAGVDIGTNTILMTIAELNGNNISAIADYHSVARLGENVDKTKNICPPALERAKSILLNYRDYCKSHSVDKILVCGTSALRDAENSQEIRAILGEAIEAPINVIKGEEEAKLSFLGAIDGNESAGLIDIGGGSSEICFGENGIIKNRVSLNIGAVRLTERYFKNLPPTKEQVEKALINLDSILESLNCETFQGKIYSVAGTATTLAAIDLNLSDFSPKLAHNHILSLQTIKKHNDNMLSLTKDELLKIKGMHPLRADLMPAGSLILRAILEKFGKNETVVSVRGLRYGIIKKLANEITGIKDFSIDIEKTFY